jgi:hypothetical protein
MISLRTERLATKTKGSADNASAMGGIRICDAGTSIQKPGVSRPISGAQRGFQLSDAIRGWKHLGPCRRFRQPEIRRCARRPAAVAAVLLVRDIAPINEYLLGQRRGRGDLAADGGASLGFTPFFQHLLRADSKRRPARDASPHAPRAVASGGGMWGGGPSAGAMAVKSTRRDSGKPARSEVGPLSDAASW